MRIFHIQCLLEIRFVFRQLNFTHVFAEFFRYNIFYVIRIIKNMLNYSMVYITWELWRRSVGDLDLIVDNKVENMILFTYNWVMNAISWSNGVCLYSLLSIASYLKKWKSLIIFILKTYMTWILGSFYLIIMNYLIIYLFIYFDIDLIIIPLQI